MNKICKKRGCKEKHYGRGLCRPHYNQSPETKKRQSAYGKKYYIENREAIQERSKQYAKDNPEKIRKLMKGYHQKNKKKLSVIARDRYRNRKKNA